jgi:TonB family protein
MFFPLGILHRPAVQATLLHLTAILLLLICSLGLQQDAGLSEQQAAADTVLMLMQYDEQESSVTEVLLAEATVSIPVAKAAPIKKATQTSQVSSKPSVLNEKRTTSGLEVLSQQEHAQPAHILNPRPDYPITLRQRGIEGTVWLRVRVDRSGLPEQIILFKTSGYRLFDEAALRAVARWRFRPARSNGQHIASWVEFPVRFILQG